MEQNNSKRRQVTGVVVSNAMDKTIVVKTSRKFPHPKYKKFIKRSKKYYAHDSSNACEKGDEVLIVESKPISKLKRWQVKEIKQKAVKL
tara:strand:- start:356 stop:622 length:267 start_codon:yes stop_codon:yes gene_type:complete